VRRLPVLTAVIGAPLAWLAGCGAPLDAPSAFEDEQYLCDVPHQAIWQQRVADCRGAYAADGSCKGVISVRGLVDSQSVTIDSPVTHWIAVDTPLRGGTVDRSYYVAGVSPYFLFNLELPGFSTVPGMSSKSILLPGHCLDQPLPECVPAVFNVEARDGSANLSMTSLVRNLSLDTRDELVVNFAGDVDGGGTLAGCFDLNLAPPP
jgi:hypothetical protein